MFMFNICYLLLVQEAGTFKRAVKQATTKLPDGAFKILF